MLGIFRRKESIYPSCVEMEKDMSEIRATLLDILSDLHPEVDFEKETNLIQDKILDSFDIVSVISDVKDELGVTITADLILPENFGSLDALVELVKSLEKMGY